MDTVPQNTGVATATKTKVSTRTKVVVGVAIASLAAAAGFGLPLLRKTLPAKCPAGSWQCSEWTACSASGTQTRACRLRSVGMCAESTKPATSQACGQAVGYDSPIITVAAIPTTVLSDGQVIVARFSATPPNNREAVIRQLTFPIAKSRELVLVGTGGSSLRRVGDAENLSGSAVLDTCNDQSLQCSVKVTMGGDEVIRAGSTMVYELRLVVSGDVPASSLVVSMDQPAFINGGWTLTDPRSAPPAGYSSPVISMTSLPTSVLNNGTDVVARFAASARNEGDAAFKTLRFTFDKSRELVLTAGNDSSLRRVGEGANLPGSTALVTCNDQSVQCSADITLAAEEIIPAGTSHVFDLRLNVAGAISGSTLLTKIEQPVSLQDAWGLTK